MYYSLFYQIKPIKPMSIFTILRCSVLGKILHSTFHSFPGNKPTGNVRSQTPYVRYHTGSGSYYDEHNNLFKVSNCFLKLQIILR